MQCAFCSEELQEGSPHDVCSSCSEGAEGRQEL